MNCKRLNVGGSSATELFKKLVGLRHPMHRPYLTHTRSQQLKEDHCYMADNYLDELALFQSGKRSDDVHVIQLPFTEVPVNQKSEEEKQKKAQVRICQLITSSFY